MRLQAVSFPAITRNQPVQILSKLHKFLIIEWGGKSDCKGAPKQALLLGLRFETIGASKFAPMEPEFSPDAQYGTDGSTVNASDANRSRKLHSECGQPNRGDLQFPAAVFAKTSWQRCGPFHANLKRMMFAIEKMFARLRVGQLLGICICTAFFLLPADAANWYAALNGQSTNGTAALPWSVEMAVGKVPNPYLKPGDTVIFEGGGSYVCTETNEGYAVGHVLEFHISGTPTAKITYRPATLWGFSFDGGLLLPTTVSNLVITEFHIYCSASTNRVRTDGYTLPPGIDDLAEGVDITHNLIENTGHPGIGSWKTTQGKYIAGNVIRFTGFNDFAGGWPGTPRGSGMYLQNLDNSHEALVQGNISYFNYTTGMKAFGHTDIWGFDFRQNICTENHEAGIFYSQERNPSAGLLVISNYFWNNDIDVRIGYPLGNEGSSNAVVSYNYAVESEEFPFYQVDGWWHNTWTHNVGVKLTDRYLWYMESASDTNGAVTSHDIDFNTYYAANQGVYGPTPFDVKDVGYDFAGWLARIHGDTNSSFSYSFPTNVAVYPFQPSRNSNFVYVAVFNWPTNSTTLVDLSPYFSPGDPLEIFDAQDIPTAYTNFTYEGGKVALDLTRTNIAPMLGTFSDVSAPWSGFDPRFRAFVIYRDYPDTDAVEPLPPTDLHVVP